MKEVDGRKGVSEEFATLASIIGDCRGTKEEYEPNWC
jgi:hypothetical protein